MRVSRCSEVLRGAERDGPTLMSDGLEMTVPTIDVLDWLASTGLGLRPDYGDGDGDGEATIGYNLAIEGESPRPAPPAWAHVPQRIRGHASESPTCMAAVVRWASPVPGWSR